MSIAGILIIIVFLLLIIIGILIIGVYNKLYFYKSKVDDKLTAINDCLNDRINISKEIINIITKENLNEDTLVRELNRLIKQIEEENNVNNLLILLDTSDEVLKKALTIDSLYKSLKNNKEYQNLVESFKNNQYKIMYAIEIYNEGVEEYSNYKNQKYINIISKIFKFTDYDYYKKDEV